MALATQCPHCGTMFRVASDQLKLRGGIVRCGSCQEIFDGSATLVDLDALPARAPVAAEPEPPAPSPAPAPAPAPVPVLAEAPAATEPAPEPVPAQAESSVAPPPFAVPEEKEEEALAPLEVAVELPNFEDQPVYTLDFDHTFDPFGILPKVDVPEVPDVPELAPVEAGTAAPATEEAPQPAPEPQAAYDMSPARDGRIEPAFGLPVDEELVAVPLPGHEPELEPEPAAPEPAPRSKAPAADAPPPLLRESPPSAVTHPAVAHIPPVARTAASKRLEKAAARRSKLTPTRIESQPKLRAAEIDEPEFVKRGRQQEQSGRTRKIALIVGSIALLVLLFTQGLLTFRNALAARFPAAKPVLVSSCAVFGCRVELPAQIDKLDIETGELTTLGGGAYSFTTELRNAGATPQAWPSLELALTDANDKPLVRRVFAPADYLAAGASADSIAGGIAPRAEQAITLHFRVDDLKPSGYHIAVFYP